jgi:hypothetical protein
MKRKLLARSSNIATRQRVYRIPDGLEVDDVDHYEVRRSRVLYDDVILVTHHRSRGSWFLIITGLMAVLFAAMAYAIGRGSTAVVGWWILAVTAGPFLLLFLIRFFLGVDEVNVYSRRSSARLRFWFRKQRALELFKDISNAVRTRQNALTRRATAAAAAASAAEDAPPAIHPDAE